MDAGVECEAEGVVVPSFEEIDTSRPHQARIYDYFLGGKDWFSVDRQVAEELLARVPHLLTSARENRAFMHRTTRTLVQEHGVRQFLDIGAGIPTAPNLHQVAQESAPESRVVYVDNDPLVVEYVDALMRGTPEGRTVYREADVRTTDVLDSAEVRDVLDLSQPVAVSLLAMLHALPDADDPYGLVRRLLAPLPAGSFLVLSHFTTDFEARRAARRWPRPSATAS